MKIYRFKYNDMNFKFKFGTSKDGGKYIMYKKRVFLFRV